MRNLFCFYSQICNHATHFKSLQALNLSCQAKKMIERSQRNKRKRQDKTRQEEGKYSSKHIDLRVILLSVQHGCQQCISDY